MERVKKKTKKLVDKAQPATKGMTTTTPPNNNTHNSIDS